MWRRCSELAKTMPPVYVESLVEEIVGKIKACQEDERLAWQGDGQVRVAVNRILPEGSAVKAALDGRRERFRFHLNDCLEDAGWSETQQDTYVHTDAPQGTPE